MHPLYVFICVYTCALGGQMSDVCTLCVFMYVHVCTWRPDVRCTYSVCVHVCVCMYTWRPDVSMQHRSQLLSSSLVLTGSLTKPEARQLCQIGWPMSSRNPPLSTPLVRGYRQADRSPCISMLDYYMGVRGNLNS